LKGIGCENRSRVREKGGGGVLVFRATGGTRHRRENLKEDHHKDLTAWHRRVDIKEGRRLGKERRENRKGGGVEPLRFWSE